MYTIVDLLGNGKATVDHRETSKKKTYLFPFKNSCDKQFYFRFLLFSLICELRCCKRKSLVILILFSLSLLRNLVFSFKSKTYNFNLYRLIKIWDFVRKSVTWIPKETICRESAVWNKIVSEQCRLLDIFYAFPDEVLKPDFKRVRCYVSNLRHYA